MHSLFDVHGSHFLRLSSNSGILKQKEPASNFSQVQDSLPTAIGQFKKKEARSTHNNRLFGRVQN